MGTKILTQLEGLVKGLQLKYMDSKRTMEVVEGGRILFHPKDCRQRIILEYEKRLKILGIKW